MHSACLLRFGAPPTVSASRCFVAARAMSPMHPGLRSTLAHSALRGTRRSLSTSSGLERVQIVRQAFAWALENRVVMMVVTGAIVVMYGFYRMSYRVMSFLINVPPHQIFHAGVVSGLIIAAFAGGGFVFLRRRLMTRVEDVYAAALKELRQNEQVTSALGGMWRPGAFQGFAMESFEDALKGSERRSRASYLEIPAQRVQMIFQLKGLDYQGIVSLEAYKRSGEYIFEMLALDVLADGALPDDERHLLLAGDKDHSLFPGIVDILSAAKKHTKPLPPGEE